MYWNFEFAITFPFKPPAQNQIFNFSPRVADSVEKNRKSGGRGTHEGSTQSAALFSRCHPFLQPSLLKHFSWSSATYHRSRWLPQTLKKISHAWLDQRHISSGDMPPRDIMTRRQFSQVSLTSCTPGVLIPVISSYEAALCLDLKTKHSSSCCCQTLTLPQSTWDNGGHLCRSV